MSHSWSLIWGLFQKLKENTLKEILLIIPLNKILLIIFLGLKENALKEALLIIPLKKIFIDNTF